MAQPLEALEKPLQGIEDLKEGVSPKSSFKGGGGYQCLKGPVNGYAWKGLPNFLEDTNKTEKPIKNFGAEFSLEMAAKNQLTYGCHPLTVKIWIKRLPYLFFVNISWLQIILTRKK